MSAISFILFYIKEEGQGDCSSNKSLRIMLETNKAETELKTTEERGICLILPII